MQGDGGLAHAQSDKTPGKSREGAPLTSQGSSKLGGPYETLICLPFPASSGDRRPATDLLCDLVQVAPILSASLSFSVKRCNWTNWNLGCLPSVALSESMILRTRVRAAERRQILGLATSVKIDEGKKRLAGHTSGHITAPARKW